MAVLIGGAGAIFWLVIAIGLFVVETMTTQMVSVWFGVGALVTILPAVLGAPVWLQLLVFLAVSVAVLFALRPMTMKKLHKEKEPTNADMVIGMTGVVIEEIDNIKQTGRVVANGLTWTARAVSDDMQIAAEAQVTVHRIEGVKLIVEPLYNTRKVEL